MLVPLLILSCKLDDFPVPGSCGTDIVATIPADGADDVWYRGRIEVVINQPDEFFAVSLTDDAGSDVPGSLTWDADLSSWIFQPTEPLESLTTYSALATTCRDEVAFSFTTSDLGEPLEVDPLGRTFSVDLGEGRWVSPPGAQYIASSLDSKLLLYLTEVDGQASVLAGQTVDDGDEQDYCMATSQYTQIELDGPDFVFGPVDVPMTLAHIPMVMQAVRMVGTLSSDSTWAAAVLTASIDSRPLAPLLDQPTDDPRAVCDLFRGFGAECEECPNGGGSFCLPITAYDLVGHEVEQLVDPVDQSWCHELCEDSDCR